MYSLRRNIAGEVQIVAAGPRLTGVAGGAGDNTLTKGSAIDVTALQSPGGGGVGMANTRYESVVFALPITATLTGAATMILNASIETSSVSNFATSTTLVPAANILTLTGPGTLNGVGKIGCSLENAMQYIRISYTGDLSAGATDTSDIAPIAIFGGPGELP